MVWKQRACFLHKRTRKPDSNRAKRVRSVKSLFRATTAIKTIGSETKLDVCWFQEFTQDKYIKANQYSTYTSRVPFFPKQMAILEGGNEDLPILIVQSDRKTDIPSNHVRLL